MLRSTSMLLVAGLTFSHASHSEQPHIHPKSASRTMFKFVGDKQFSGFCQAVLNNDVSELQSNISRHLGSVAASRKAVLQRVLGDGGVTCNGEDLVSFANQRQATDIRAFLLAQYQ